jgi:glycosyltransferase involved in cell wall biosynthesis
LKDAGKETALKTADTIKVLHLITGLGTGGAEMMLYKLLSHMDRSAFQNEVLSLTDCGPIGQKILALGLPVNALEMPHRMPSPQGIAEIVRRIRLSRPDVIQTWMYHADLLGGIAARFAGDVPVIWTAKLCASLAPYLPAKIICCSETSAQIHVDFGYPARKMVVIPNGFSLEDYRPDREARLRVRQELGLHPETPLIGLIARFDPAKDHANFIRAAGLLHPKYPKLHFLLCGKGVTPDNPILADQTQKAGVTEVCHLLGLRQDVAALTAALDIATSSSLGEGFPNVIGEAMACGIPCVVTDVGDSALLVGETGRVVPPGDSPALAGACQEILDMEGAGKCKLGALARQRVETLFDIKLVAQSYQKLYQEVSTTCVG